MFIIQLIEIGGNDVIEQVETRSEIKAMDIQRDFENKNNQNKCYTRRFCSDCGHESCCC